jgi:hypothetical protein
MSAEDVMKVTCVVKPVVAGLVAICGLTFMFVIGMRDGVIEHSVAVGTTTGAAVTAIVASRRPAA